LGETARFEPAWHQKKIGAGKYSSSKTVVETDVGADSFRETMRKVRKSLFLHRVTTTE
jgi:hypothetical protein